MRIERVIVASMRSQRSRVFSACSQRKVFCPRSTIREGKTQENPCCPGLVSRAHAPFGQRRQHALDLGADQEESGL